VKGLTRIHHGAHTLAGPLMYVANTLGAVLGELAHIEVPGQPPRRGQVIDVGTEVSVVQVMEETIGISPANVRLTLRGELAGAPVGRELLGRVFSGSGAPLDGLPAPIGEAWRPLYGAPLNPTRRRKLSNFVETGLSAIDGMNTLIRGQKLPVFSGSGLPGLELATRIVEGSRAAGHEAFAVIFAGIGITERETQLIHDQLASSEAAERSILYLNRASDPAIERLLAPRLALTAAEYLAFDLGMHVLVVLCDITHYCDALREIGAAREEVPGRRGYPGYLYTDLATLFERAGVLRDGEGSLTQIPILTMPDDDITHPIPDLTGYITEGQIVLSRELDRAGVFPPVDVLPSLSRVMNAGIGEGQTAPHHRAWSDQLYAVYARGREARLSAGVVGETGLSEADRRALAFAERFEHEFVHQGKHRRSIGETLELGWRLLESQPREDLSRLDPEVWSWRGAQREQTS
jgi:V/A-type H+-transporting ATPase subunit B